MDDVLLLLYYNYGIIIVNLEDVLSSGKVHRDADRVVGRGMQKGFKWRWEWVWEWL